VKRDSLPKGRSGAAANDPDERGRKNGGKQGPGAGKKKDDHPLESSQWDCLIACPAGIFSVGTLREVIEYNHYWADGSGTRFALGAMHATYELHDSSEILRVRRLQQPATLMTDQDLHFRCLPFL